MTPDVLPALLSLRAQVDALIAQVQPTQTAPRPTQDPKWMTLPAFCRRWSIARSTLYLRLAEGLPSEGTGRRRRIETAAGDAWMRTHGHATPAPV